MRGTLWLGDVVHRPEGAENMEKEKKRRHQPMRTAYTQHISARLPIEQYERLCALCKARGTTVTAAVCVAVERYLDSEEELDSMLGGGDGSFIIL